MKNHLLNRNDQFKCLVCQAELPELVGDILLRNCDAGTLMEEDVANFPLVGVCRRPGPPPPQCTQITSVVGNNPGPLRVGGKKPLSDSAILLTDGGGMFQSDEPSGVITGAGPFLSNPPTRVGETPQNREVRAELACVSWIDKRSGVYPEDGDGPPAQIKEEYFEASQGFRFVNRLSIKATIVDGQVQKVVWRPSQQRLFHSNTFYIFPVEEFIEEVKADRLRKKAQVQSTVGARTTAPEVGLGCAIGSISGFAMASIPGALDGCVLGANVLGDSRVVFPPIWTTLSITVAPSGDCEFKLHRHSLFPNHSVYMRMPTGDLDPTTPFDLIQKVDQHNNVELWRQNGWGSLEESGFGNPWGIKKTLSDG